MKSGKLGWILSAVVIATMAGCGTNGDPGAKKYALVNKGATQKPGNTDNAGTGSTNAKEPLPQPTPPPPPSPWNCDNPVKIEVVEKEIAKGIMLFTAGQESKYTLKVTSNVGAGFNIELANLAPELSADVHAGRAKFDGKISGSVGTYTFTWKPAKGADDLAFKELSLKFTPSRQTACSIVIENVPMAIKAQVAAAAGGTK